MLTMKKEFHAHDSDYTLDFGSGVNNNGCIQFTDHATKKESSIGITIDDEEFNYRVKQEFPSVVADLIDLAVAIHFADRLAFQNLRQDQSRIYVKLAVRHPEIMNTELFRSQLEILLEWATGSLWLFDFQKRSDSERSVVRQPSLPVASQDCEVAMWSGGLDAFAGLYQRLRSHPEKSFLLFGTGGNVNVHKLQEDTEKQIRSIFPNRCTLYRVPIRFFDSNAVRKNKITRARGVVFAMLGAACASLMGRQDLCFYENGTGAINLPYRESALGLDHTRSVHPLTLLKVSDLISGLLGEAFRVWNPFLFSTKSEMCQILAEDVTGRLSSQTKSCDSPHRHNISQCGYCSSCLLRRQALSAAKIEDKTRYLILHGNYSPAKDPSESLRHMLAQVETLRCLLNRPNSHKVQWEALTRKFPIIDDIVDQCSVVEKLTTLDMQSKLIRLYQNYVAEWDDVKSQLSVNLIKNTESESLYRN
ncbi:MULTISPECIES: 7-cyano-7-deazaguanine synthase [unclassified Microcoleus]|uniref:7-cyano-7-deazaguanine synthase n=2 Tax=Microcoleus TaxID=44471 RepID=UPI002FD3D9EF